jgi:hypothetical protein
MLGQEARGAQSKAAGRPGVVSHFASVHEIAPVSGDNTLGRCPCLSREQAFALRVGALADGQEREVLQALASLAAACAMPE